MYMGRLEYLSKAPRDLGLTKKSAKRFYARMGAPSLYEHVMKVQKRAENDRVVEKEPIFRYDQNNPEKAKRAWANHDLAVTNLFHLIDYDKLMFNINNQKQILLPQMVVSDEAIMGELEIFSRLSELNCRKAPAEEYVNLLNNRSGPPPLALLSMMVDLAVTHLEGDDLDGIAGPDYGLFRTYNTKAEAEVCLRNDASAGERIYAKLAELFGYPQLAGDIYYFAYEVNHPLIFEHVKELKEDDRMNSCLENTQGLVRNLEKDLRYILKRLGFSDARIIVREEKHDGKKMKKIFDEMKEELPNKDEPCFDSYLVKNLDKCDLFWFPDPVAMKIVVDKFKHTSGKEVDIDELPMDERMNVLNIAVKQIKTFLNAFEMSYGYKHTNKFRSKPNGYKDFKFVARPNEVNGFLPFEIQLKTSKWHYLAEYGGSAHYLYLNRNDPEGKSIERLINVLKSRYKGIIHNGLNG